MLSQSGFLETEENSFIAAFLNIYRPQRSCGQGYVFTRVCDSVHGGGSLGRPPPGQGETPPPTWQGEPPWTRQTPPGTWQGEPPPDQADPPDQAGPPQAGRTPPPDLAGRTPAGPGRDPPQDLAGRTPPRPGRPPPGTWQGEPPPRTWQGEPPPGPGRENTPPRPGRPPPQDQADPTPPPPPPGRRLQRTVNERPVRILLECILVNKLSTILEIVSCRFLDVRKATYTHDFKCSTAPAGLMRCVTASPDGNWVAVGYSSGIISVVDTRTGLLLASWKGHEGELLQVC